MSQYKGRRVRKKFPGYKKPFEGTVADYDSDEVLWSIKYEDGDGEDVEEHELFEIILEEAPEEDVPDDAGKAAAKKGKKKLLQLQRTRGENAQALAGSSGAAAQGKRNLHSPAETAAERHAKKQKQDGKKRADALGSAATDKRRKAKESALPKTAEAVDKEEAGRGAGASELEVTGIKRGAPTSGPLAGPTRFHNHVIYGRTGYIAGQTATDPSVQDYRIQTQQVLQQLDKQLKAAGTSKNHLLKATVLLKDIALGADVFNAVWEKWINPQHAPARTTFEASLIHPELLVEVDAIAALPANLDILE
ncbi:hypothetical protein WJX75_003727 [Coccomyxa subellipsoidea]|uniref:PTM/DIR17-like Tudor domain-containing protein n=1 Tax=Coccomyxa subellipsoidea TaxID=248742 RepID=A0ABR2YL02_9CHLO